MTQRWIVKQHAIDRYLLRIDGRPSGARAKQLLELAGETAERLNENTHDGASQYRCSSLGCVAICREAHETNGAGRVMVSVISPEMCGCKVTVADAFGAALDRPLLPHLPDDEPIWGVLRREVGVLLGDYILRAGLVRLPVTISTRVCRFSLAHRAKAL